MDVLINKGRSDEGNSLNPGIALTAMVTLLTIKIVDTQGFRSCIYVKNLRPTEYKMFGDLFNYENISSKTPKTLQHNGLRLYVERFYGHN